MGDGTGMDGLTKADKKANAKALGLTPEEYEPLLEEAQKRGIGPGTILNERKRAERESKAPAAPAPPAGAQ
jgi:hypothetical protein